MAPRSDDQTLERMKEMQAEVLTAYGTEAKSRYLTLTDPPIQVHLWEAGEGEPVILLHGGPSQALQFVPIMSALERQFHLVAPDLPGFGLTQEFDWRILGIPELARRYAGSLMDEIGFERAHLVGNSIGGYWCLRFAMAHPERVDKLAMLGGTYGLDRSLPLFLRLAGRRGLNRFLFATIFRPSLRGTRIMYKSLGNDVEMIPPEYLECEYMHSTLRKVRRATFSATGEATTLRGVPRKYYLREELTNISIPTLFIWGDRDAAVPLESGKEAVGLMPNARLEVVADAGHLPWWDEPERCTKLLLEFLEASPSAS